MRGGGADAEVPAAADAVFSGLAAGVEPEEGGGELHEEVPDEGFVDFEGAGERLVD